MAGVTGTQSDVVVRAMLTDEPDEEVVARADWLPPKPMQVDPAKDVQATVAEIDAGLTSRRKAVAERGWDVDELDEELAAEDRRPAKESEV